MIYGHLGVSADTAVVGTPSRRLSWRPVAANPGSSVHYERRSVGHLEDLDLQNGRVAWIGLPAAANRTPSPDYSGVVWVDRLAEGLETPRRLLSDLGATPGQRIEACSSLGNGALRFQPDGSLLVAAGFLPDVVLLDPAGRPARRWDNQGFGIDTAAACAEMGPAERRRLDSEPKAVPE